MMCCQGCGAVLIGTRKSSLSDVLCAECYLNPVNKRSESLESETIEVEPMSRKLDAMIQAEASKHVEIDRPAHYVGGGIECVDYITSHRMEFRDGNVVKYITRFRKKYPTAKEQLTDLYKARQYLNMLVDEWESRAKEAN